MTDGNRRVRMLYMDEHIAAGVNKAMIKDAMAVHIENLPHSQAMPENIGVVLADAYPILLDGMERLFRSEPGFTVLACCKTAEETIRAVTRHRPHIVVLDFALVSESGFDVVQQIRRENARLVLNGERFNEGDILEATRLGVRGLILKSMPATLLVQCVRKVHRGATWIEKTAMSLVVEQLVTRSRGEGDRIGRLTPRELEVLRMVARGESNKEIANALCVGEGTVKAHVHHVYEKLGVRGRLELVLAAQSKGLLSAFSSRPSISYLK